MIQQGKSVNAARVCRSPLGRWLIFVGFLLVVAGCSTNPVTGERELSLIPESMEIEMGEENYLPARQMQGGDYQVHPEVVAYVREVGKRLAAVADRKLPYEFTVVNDPEINAWMMPGGKMAVNRGLLLKLDSEAELAAVMGHEIVHAAARHGVHHQEEEMLLEGAVLAASLAISANTDKEWVRTVGILGAGMAGTLLSAKFSRDDEREADHYGMIYMARAGYDPRAAIAVQEMLLREGKGGNDLVTRLLSDHPISEERVAAARAWAKTLPAKGEIGRERYHQRLAALFKDAPAYEKYDQARKAREKGDYRRALTLVQEAIHIQPAEGLFHLLQGELYEQSYHEKMALAAYREAARLDPGYYQPHLKLGLLLDAMGKPRQARIALENSLRLLKTAAALHRLGRYALNSGDRERARALFKEAAASDTEEGRAAYAELLRIDLPVNAGDYLDVSLGQSSDGHVLVTVTNNTPFPVTDIVLEASGPDGVQRITLPDGIPANDSNTYRGAKASEAQIGALDVRVVSARMR